MSSWSFRRQATYLTAILIFFGLIFASVYLVFFRKAPSCFDNIQNQGELGIDCGGPCSKVCSIEVSPLIKDWARLFKTGDGRYDVAALIENPNFNLGLKKLDYTFKLYDGENLFITEKSGSVFVNARDKFAIFESNLDTGKRIPIKTIIEFNPNLVWSRVDPEASKLPITVQNPILTEGTMPHLSAELVNNSVFDLSNILTTAVIYDDDDNAIASSQTFTNYIPKSRSSDIVFTWPITFTAQHPTFEIFPRVNLVK
ncbi:MAG: hypothetical protein HY226_04385 [Candidatus Vogelbacteria bacterium]|nr:hypothetical protein [Candidatus Vogelbacteria bacterium]